jgi:hypothetical protein
MNVFGYMILMHIYMYILCISMHVYTLLQSYVYKCVYTYMHAYINIHISKDRIIILFFLI